LHKKQTDNKTIGAVVCSLKEVYVIKVLRQGDIPDLRLDPERVWCMAGYTDPNRARPIMQKAFQKSWEVGPTLLEPAACYDTFPITDITSNSVTVNGVSFQSGNLSEHFREAMEMTVLIVTIGPRLEKYVEKMFEEGNSGAGCILDLLGSAAVDKVAYRVRDLIQEKVIEKGYRTMSHGYCIGKACPAYTDCGGVVAYWWSPGYGDMETREQKKLFSLLDGSIIGVHLEESCMMTPRKSYACLIPIGPQGENLSYPCDEGQKDWIRQGSLKHTD
jgi:hypothetical protein